MDTRLEALSVKALIAFSDQTEGHFPSLQEKLDSSREFGGWNCRCGSVDLQSPGPTFRMHTVSSIWEDGNRPRVSTGRNSKEIGTKTTEKGKSGKGQIPAIRPFARKHLSSAMSYRTLPDLESRSKYPAFRALYGVPLLHTSHRSRMIKTAVCLSPTFVPFHMELTAAFGLSHSPH